MTKPAVKKPTVDTTAAFTFANMNKQCPEQAAVTRECKQPQTPRQITNEDWTYGIGLN